MIDCLRLLTVFTEKEDNSMNCKYCQHALEEGVTLCPECGKDNAETVTRTAEETVEETVEKTVAETGEEAAAESNKTPPGKLALMIGACVVLLAVLVALIMGGRSAAENADSETGTSESSSAASGTEEDATELTEATEAATVPADTLEDNVTYKGSYTVSDEDMAANADVVVATMGDRELTNSELQVYYGMMINQFMNNEFYYLYYYYGYYFDYTQPLDTYVCLYDETLTWHQYFLEQAFAAWHSYNALTIEAEKAAFVLPEEYQTVLDSLETDLNDTAVSAGFADAQEYVEYYLGTGATVEAYASFMEVYYMGYSYYLTLVEDIVPTEEEIEEYFLLHEEEYAQNGLTREDKTIDVRHILILPEGATTSTVTSETFSEEAWAAAETQANAILAEWLAGEATGESFGALANAYSADAYDSDGDGVNDDGGLYTQVSEGDMVTNFNDWCFDESRVAGDYGIVQTEFGYHVMYFVGEEPLWRAYAEEDLITEQYNAVIQDAEALHPIQIDYSKIMLGYLSMA